jgi:transcriptional regulator with XRE-family HTH domain
MNKAELREVTRKRNNLIKGCNFLGSRFRFVRKELEIPVKEIAHHTNIKIKHIYNIETGHRTTFYETMLCLAVFYDQHWQEKYTDEQYPKYRGKQVEMITFEWLLFGFDLLLEKMNNNISILEENYKRKEKELFDSCLKK